MSGRLEALFAQRRREGKKVLVTYLCVGDPSVDESVDLAVVAAEAGADVLELGVPFSDPTADGPAIVRASERALARGGGLVPTLAACRRVRARTEAPIVLFGYYNPLYVHGLEETARDAAEAGVDALLIVDLPVDASQDLRKSAAARGLSVVPLLAPTSSPARAEAVRRADAWGPSAFLYYVSLIGVTGAASSPLAEASRMARKLGDATLLPVVVGFGVDSASKARAAAADADGVVVGTALVRRIEEGVSREARATSVRAFVAELRGALDSRPSS